MLQKFNTDTLASRFIKSLLAQSPIPLFECVMDNDNLIQGCYYVYKQYIIKCVSSGKLYVSGSETLYPSDLIYPSVYLLVGIGYVPAQFQVISLIDTEDITCFNNYNSSTSYYDSETHIYLGKYLRFLRNTTELNLMPFYNCYSGLSFSDVELSRGSSSNVTSAQNIFIHRVTSSKYKVVAIPILFNRTYTVAVDCSSEVLLRACIRASTGFIDESENTQLNESLKESLSASARYYSRLEFRKPIQFRFETQDHDSMLLQKDLYLIIQLPVNNKSTITVLEDYSNNQGVVCNENSVREPLLVNTSLLQMNTYASYAFADRLVEYLLHNVIHKDDPISQNIAKIQQTFCEMYSGYKRAFMQGKKRFGVWDEDIPRLVLDIVTSYSKDNMIYDQDGFINKDVEAILLNKGVSY